MSEVRLLSLEDAEAFHALRLRAVREETASFLEDATDVMNKPPASYFDNGWIAGASSEGKLVGITGLFRHKGKKVQHKGTVWGVYVVPQMRGHGLARRMIEIVIEKAADAGLEVIHISADSKNLMTQDLYKSLGFEPYGTERRMLKLADGSYIDDVLMAKILK